MVNAQRWEQLFRIHTLLEKRSPKSKVQSPKSVIVNWTLILEEISSTGGLWPLDLGLWILPEGPAATVVWYRLHVRSLTGPLTDSSFTNRNGFAAGCAAGLAPPETVMLNRAMPLVRALPLFTSTRTLANG